MIKKLKIKPKRKKKIRPKKTTLKGLKCGSNKELRFLKECIKKNTLPSKPVRIETPYGYYTPDFEFPDKYIEVKSLHTFKVMLGEKSYIKDGKVSDLQFQKIKWVANNIKKIDIILYLSKTDKYISPLDISNINVKIKGGYKPKIKKEN